MLSNSNAENDQRRSLREIITREMIANVLIHREFTSSFAEGDKLAFVVMDGTLMMRPMKMPDKAEFEKSLHDANKTFSK